ncbi:MAG: RecQ family ATP-dependent DNA helicase [Lachnospiraceae bacterium]|nr:RecQ family ATP-dependent DNA helicase [Lachnospiraceae bacterium]
MSDKYSILKEYFGYDEFRSGQEPLMDGILAGRDVLGIMPTGAGKSMCYQIPALLMSGITLVISPLISLMKDQVESLNQAGIHAAYLNSSLTHRQYELALSYAAQGRYKIIYVAPERLTTGEFLEFAMNTEISMISIDEAHCVSQWGQDFRPSYLRILDFIKLLPARPVISAFTATATAAVRDDVLRILQLQDPLVETTGFDRSNLYFQVETPKDKYAALLNHLDEFVDQSGIIYCLTRKVVEEVCSKLNRDGFPATRYHAGLSDRERQQNQEDFIYDVKPIMVATNAFGMGIDKSNVRFVVHYNMPKNMESYYQEAGRAGRDGEPSKCFLLYGGQDVVLNQFFINHNRDNNELSDEQLALTKKLDEDRLRQMTFYCFSKTCLRKYILDYFGERLKEDCDNCSVCLHVVEPTEKETSARAMGVTSAYDGTARKPKQSAARKTTAKTPKNTPVDKDLFEQLRMLRLRLARENKVPPYVIFSDKTLTHMCQVLPKNELEMLTVSGVGMVKYQRYGEAFLEVIQRHRG